MCTVSYEAEEKKLYR